MCSPTSPDIGVTESDIASGGNNFQFLSGHLNEDLASILKDSLTDFVNSITDKFALLLNQISEFQLDNQNWRDEVKKLTEAFKNRCSITDENVLT